MKNNDTWIKVEKIVKDPQDPIRPARSLNGVKLDGDEVANIIQPPMLPER